MKLFVVNVTTEPGETESFDLLDHVQAIEDHVGPNLFDFILVNSDTAPQLPAAARNRSFVLASASHQAQLVARGYETFTDSVISHELPVHHDSELLASTIFQIYFAAEGQAPFARDRTARQPGGQLPQRPHALIRNGRRGRHCI